MSAMIYTITLVKGLRKKSEENSWGYSYDEIWTAGYYTKKTEATTCIEEFYEKLGERGKYQYAVIETYEEGIAKYDLHPIWYKWDYEEEKYIEIDDPVRHITNWAFR